MSKPILTPYQRSWLQDWVDSNKSRLGLDHWTIKVEDKPSDIEHAAASTHMQIESSHARIRLSKVWLDMTADEKRQTLVHELLHPHLRDVGVCANEFGLSELKWNLLNRAMERGIDSIACAIAPTFDPINLRDPLSL